MSSIPSATSCWEMAARSTTSADGQGRRPAAAPMLRRPAVPRRRSGTCEWAWPCACACGLRVRACAVRVRVRVPVRFAASSPEPRAQHGSSHRDHHQARDQRQPGVELLGKDVLRERECYETQREDPDRVRDRDGHAEQHGVTRRSAGPDQVGGDHRLAVARRERMQRAPAEGRQEHHDQHAATRGRVREQRGEAVRARRGLGAVACRTARRAARAAAAPRVRHADRARLPALFLRRDQRAGACRYGEVRLASVGRGVE